MSFFGATSSFSSDCTVSVVLVRGAGTPGTALLSEPSLEISTLRAAFRLASGFGSVVSLLLSLLLPLSPDRAGSKAQYLMRAL